jgi:hypothetical protein
VFIVQASLLPQVFRTLPLHKSSQRHVTLPYELHPSSPFGLHPRATYHVTSFSQCSSSKANVSLCSILEHDLNIVQYFSLSQRCYWGCVPVFWDVPLHRWIKFSTFRRAVLPIFWRGTLIMKYYLRSSWSLRTFFRNVGNYSPNDAVLHLTVWW